MLKAIDHVNIVVRDMQPMLAFYTDCLGMQVTKDVVITGDWIEQVVGLKDVNARVIYLDIGDASGPRIELIEYENPPCIESSSPNAPNLLGIRHMAFSVDGIQSIVARLTEQGVTFNSTVMQVPSSQVTYAGSVRKHLVYFRDPEGNILELCEYSVGQ